MTDYLPEPKFGLRSTGRGRNRMTGSLAQQLAVKILKGEWPEGHLFPGEIEFSEQLSISRSALREAFRSLAAKGLVDSRPKAGTRVNARRQWSLEATGNDAIVALASSIMAAIAWTTIFKQRKRALPRDPIPDHHALFDAIAARNTAGAEMAMHDLIRLALADTEFSMRDP